MVGAEDRLRDRAEVVQERMDEMEAAVLARGSDESFTEEELREYTELTEDRLAIRKSFKAVKVKRQGDMADWLRRRGLTEPGQLADGVPAVFDDGARMGELGNQSRPSRNVSQAKPYEGRHFRELFGTPRGNDGFATPGDFWKAVAEGQHLPNLRGAMSAGIPAEGGFLLPESYAAETWDVALEDQIIMPHATVWPMKANVRHVPAFDDSDHSSSLIYGVKAFWVGESEEEIDQKLKTREIRLEVGELRLHAAATAKMLAESTDVVGLIEPRMRGATAWRLDDTFINGDGAGKPLGILNGPSKVEVTKETGQLSGTFLYENAVAMYSRLHPASRRRARWIVNNSVLPQLLTMTLAVGTSGQVIPVLKEQNGELTLIGLPISTTEKNPALGTSGDVILADLSQYVIGARREILLERSVAARWYQNELAFRATVFIDGQDSWSAPLTPKTGSTLGWCIVVESRT